MNIVLQEMYRGVKWKGFYDKCYGIKEQLTVVVRNIK